MCFKEKTTLFINVCEFKSHCFTQRVPLAELGGCFWYQALFRTPDQLCLQRVNFARPGPLCSSTRR